MTQRWVVFFLLMGIYFLIWILPVLLTSLFLAGIGLVYLLMGVNQLVTGYKEQSPVKQKAGWRTLLISIGFLLLVIFLFWWFIKTL